MRDKKQTSRLFQLALNDAIQSRLGTVSKIKAEIDKEKKQRCSKGISKNVTESLLSSEMMEFMEKLKKVEKVPCDEKQSGYLSSRKSHRYKENRGGLTSNDPLNCEVLGENYKRRLDFNSVCALNKSRTADWIEDHNYKTNCILSMENKIYLNETSANSMFTSDINHSSQVNIFPQRNVKPDYKIPLVSDSDDSTNYDLPIFSNYEMHGPHKTNRLTSDILDEGIPPPSYERPSELNIYQQPLKGLDFKTKTCDINYIPGPSYDSYAQINNKLEGFDPTDPSDVQNTAYFECASYNRCYSNSSKLKHTSGDLCEEPVSVINNAMSSAENFKASSNFRDFSNSPIEPESLGNVANIPIIAPNLTEDHKTILSGLFPNSSRHCSVKPPSISPLDSFTFESIYESLNSLSTESYPIEAAYANKNETGCLLRFDDVTNESKSSKGSSVSLDEDDVFLTKHDKIFNSMQKALGISSNNQRSHFQNINEPQYFSQCCDNTRVSERLNSSSLTLYNNAPGALLEEFIDKSFLKNNKSLYTQTSVSNHSVSPLKHSNVAKSTNQHEMDHSDASDNRSLKNIKSKRSEKSFINKVASLDSGFEFSSLDSLCNLDDSLAAFSNSRLNPSKETEKMGLNTSSSGINLNSKSDTEPSVKTFLFKAELHKLSENSDFSDMNNQFHQHESNRIFNLIDDFIEKS